MAIRDFENIEANASNLILSAFIMADSFFCAILQKDKDKIPTRYTLKSHYSFSDIDFSDSGFVDRVQKHPLWELPFAKISILNFTNKNLTLPLGIDSNIVYSVPMFDLQQVYIQKVVNQDLATYFGFAHAQQMAMRKWLDGKAYEVHHFPSVLSSFFIGEGSSFFHIHIEDKRCYLYGQRDQKMTFYNSYEMIENTDLLYHLLNTISDMGDDPLSTKVTMSGWVEEDSTVFKLLKGYIGDLRIIGLDQSFQLSTEAEGYQSHHYFAHFAHALCV